MAGGASSSSSSTFTYDVFLSFRGKDTRYVFTGNLYSALKNRGINAFLDDAELRRGKEITPSLLSAIERSRIAIVVLSTNYATSSFCLNELVQIMECVHEQDRLVIPVFYEVAPTEVRHLTGTYGDALNAHENKFKAKEDKLDEKMERLERWKIALKQVADLFGYSFVEDRDEYQYEFIEKIVERVSREVRRGPLPNVDHPVGLHSRVEEVTSLLDLGSINNVRMVGILGAGGIGKTTLAVAVYNLIADSPKHSSFELCFMEGIRENAATYGLPYLQKILLSKLFGENRELASLNEGISMLQSRLQGKKVFLILDDVDQEDQLKALAGRSDWFCPGSRVIITTRDVKLLSRYEDKITYELETLNENDALELLSWKTFKTNQVDPSYMNFLYDVVTYASGLPLALDIIGSNLGEPNIEQWKSILDQYKRIPNKKINTILKVSYDALEEFEKEVFLDIACCFKGYELMDVKEILCAHHSVDSLDYGLRVLVEKSLIKINRLGCVILHDLIQEMGREIVCQESRKRPGERSRLWHLQDIVEVFGKNKGTDRIEMIHMDFSLFEKIIQWNGEAFKKMENLKTLIIRKDYSYHRWNKWAESIGILEKVEAPFSQGVKHLPNSLRVLIWIEYPSHFLPSDFYPDEVVILQLSGSNLQSINILDNQEFMSLTNLKLDGSNIEVIPDVSNAPNLEKISFCWCDELIKVHESIGFLDKLKYLSAEGCSNLKSFPPIKLPNLEKLILSWCTVLENFPEILGKMENIVKIGWNGTSIKEFPSSVANFTKLRRLIVAQCDTIQLSSIIVMLPYLEEVYLKHFTRLQYPKQDEVGEQASAMVSSNARVVTFDNCHMSDEFVPIVLTWFRNVKYLDLSWNTFTVLPESIKELCSLRSLILDECWELREIRAIPPNIKYFHARRSESLAPSSVSMLLNEQLHADGDKRFYLQGSSIPNWFEHISREDSISFWFRNKLPVISLCAVVVDGVDIVANLIINGNEDPSNHIDLLKDDFQKRDHVIIIDHESIKSKYKADEVLSANEWNHAEFRIKAMHDRIKVMPDQAGEPATKGIGIHVLKHTSSMEDIRFIEPLLHQEVVNMGVS